MMNQSSNLTHFTSQAFYDQPVANMTSFDRKFLHWSFIVLEVVAIVVIVVGDISMLMLFFTRKLLGQSTNILVFSVAIGDLVNGILTFPLAMLQQIMHEPSEFMCKGYFYFANVSKTAVGYTILLLAMERIAAVLNCTYRILPPGRCLFFASLTWFFSAAYNIWSVVIYDLEAVEVLRDVSDPGTFSISGYSICFASQRFMYLHEIFEYLNPLVTFAFPAVSSNLLFLGFWLKRDTIAKPGRPYKSSKSVVIFTFALLMSFVATHIPWEMANLIFIHDARFHTVRELMVLKILHIITFSRGFWDIFIFGAFRRYVCKKEKALAHFREQRSLQVQRSSLSIPVTADRNVSLSLLDSDPSVSRRYSSDNTISRRASAMDEVSVCSGGGGGVEASTHQTGTGTQKPGDLQLSTAQESRKKSTTITTTIISGNFLIPRSPCHHDHSRRFSFVPPSIPLLQPPPPPPPPHLSTHIESSTTSIVADSTSSSNTRTRNGKVSFLVSPERKSNDNTNDTTTTTTVSNGVSSAVEKHDDTTSNLEGTITVCISPSSSSSLSLLPITAAAATPSATDSATSSTATSKTIQSATASPSLTILSTSLQSTASVPKRSDFTGSTHSLIPPDVLLTPAGGASSTPISQGQGDESISRAGKQVSTAAHIASIQNPQTPRTAVVPRKKPSLVFLETSFDVTNTSPTTTAVLLPKQKQEICFEFGNDL